ncbi:hypothetical protein ACFV7Q_33295 [Streptomyces sp. NPDC059851]|uniref:hypothetical protein n=1 Tax=Streptomyces sp. NPDC059851 TaxID=3346971 RepID=UPI003664C96A
MLTQAVFGLEVRDSSLHPAIQAAVSRFDTFEEVLEHLGGELGSEGRGPARILLAEKAEDEGEAR